MIIYLDESGDMGFETTSPTKYLVISYIGMKDAKKLKRKVLRFKHKLWKGGWDKSIEPKWSNSKKETRLDFLSQINNCNFEVHAIILNKSSIPPKFRTPMMKNYYYNFCAGKILIPRIALEKKVDITLDKRTTKVFGLNEFNGYIKIESIFYANSILEEISISHSESHIVHGLMVADFIAGAVGSKWGSSRNSNPDDSYYNIIKDKIKTEMAFLFFNKKSGP